MIPEQFCYWLQGYSELTNEVPTKEQWENIQEHLNLVFTKVTKPINLSDYAIKPSNIVNC